jgi:hypothetical protein
MLGQVSSVGAGSSMYLEHVHVHACCTITKPDAARDHFPRTLRLRISTAALQGRLTRRVCEQARAAVRKLQRSEQRRQMPRVCDLALSLSLYLSHRGWPPNRFASFSRWWDPDEDPVSNCVHFPRRGCDDEMVALREHRAGGLLGGLAARGEAWASFKLKLLHSPRAREASGVADIGEIEHGGAVPERQRKTSVCTARALARARTPMWSWHSFTLSRRVAL